MTLPGADSFERAGLLAWPGTEVEWDGQWVRRAAGGYTKRANSVQCLDPGDDGDAGGRLNAARRWFEDRGLPPVMRTTPLAGPKLLAALAAEGWRSIELSHLYAMKLGPIEPDERFTLAEPLDPHFIAAQQELHGYSDAQTSGMRTLLAALSVKAIGVTFYEDGAPLASGLMAVADGIVVTGNVVTAPATRRRGLAGAMMRTGLHWARGNGATIAALNVTAENAAAQSLYRGLGYAHQYDYCYWLPGAPQ